MSVRMQWRDAVWESELPPTVRLVALAYADHAPDDGSGVWVTVDRLKDRTGLGRSAILAAVAKLRADGWLATVKRSTQHAAPVYDLIPQGSASRTSGPSQGSAIRTSGGPGVREVNAQGSARRTQLPTEPPTKTDVPREPNVVVVVDRYSDTYLAVRGLRPRRPLLDRVAEVAAQNLAQGAPVEILLAAVPEAVRRDEPWIDRYTAAARPPASGPLTLAQSCPEHPGESPSACRVCRSEVLAGER